MIFIFIFLHTVESTVVMVHINAFDEPKESAAGGGGGVVEEKKKSHDISLHLIAFPC